MVGRRLATHRRAIDFIRCELRDFEKEYSWQMDQSATLYYVWRKWWLQIILAENLDRFCNSYYISDTTFRKLVDYAMSAKRTNDYNFSLRESIRYFWGDMTVGYHPIESSDDSYFQRDIYEDHL